MKTFVLFAVVFAAPVFGGCYYRHAYVYHDNCYEPAVVTRHVDGCCEGTVVTHVHGPNCGHAWSNGCWVPLRPACAPVYGYCGPHVIVAPYVPVYRPFSWGWHFGPSVVVRHSHNCR